MPRTADYTIQGFLYQFNKTVLEILNSPGDAEITVEGIIEDIDVSKSSGMTAIQCKYHEASDNFTPSAIYKPVLQMMSHFCDNEGCRIEYVLFAYFPGVEKGTYSVNESHIEAALNSKNKELVEYTSRLRNRVDAHDFLRHFRLEFGPRFDILVEEVQSALRQGGIPEGDVDILAYPNAVNLIATLAAKHAVGERTITRAKLLTTLTGLKKVAVSRWTLALKTRRQILDAKRKQLKPNLDKNTRLRYFLIRADSLDDFDSEIVTFIRDYIDKYHFKPAHISTPLVCLDCSEEAFDDVQLRLHKKGIVSEDGFVGRVFDEARFFREPMHRKKPSGGIEREFSVRLLLWRAQGSVLGSHKPDDVFILGREGLSDLIAKDVNVEVLAATNLKEIKYVLGVSNVCE